MSKARENAQNKQIAAGNHPKQTGLTYEEMRDFPRNISTGLTYRRMMENRRAQGKAYDGNFLDAFDISK